MAEDQKYSKFVAAITREANEKREEITKQTEEYIKSSVEQAENDILKDSYRQIRRKTAVLKEDIGRDLSHNELNIRKRLFVRREEIKNEVFEKAKQKILEFSSDNDSYRKFLTLSVDEILKEIENPKKITVYLRKEDLKYSELIKKALGVDCEFVFDNTIVLGGIRVRNDLIEIDDTLDTRLTAQNEWFEENSGLTIE